MSISRKEPNLLKLITDLEERLKRVETIGNRAYVSTGAPTHVAPPGTMYLDSDTGKLYVRGTAAWHAQS